MTPGIVSYVFVMMVYCMPGASTCKVEYGHGIYPTLDECVQAAPAWVWASRNIDKRQVHGALCELASRPPVSYTVDASTLAHIRCGQQERHCEARHKTETDNPEDP